MFVFFLLPIKTTCFSLRPSARPWSTARATAAGAAAGEGSQSAQVSTILLIVFLVHRSDFGNEIAQEKRCFKN